MRILRVIVMLASNKQSKDILTSYAGIHSIGATRYGGNLWQSMRYSISIYYSECLEISWAGVCVRKDAARPTDRSLVRPSIAIPSLDWFGLDHF